MECRRGPPSYHYIQMRLHSNVVRHSMPPSIVHLKSLRPIKSPSLCSTVKCESAIFVGVPHPPLTAGAQVPIPVERAQLDDASGNSRQRVHTRQKPLLLWAQVLWHSLHGAAPLLSFCFALEGLRLRFRCLWTRLGPGYARKLCQWSLIT